MNTPTHLLIGAVALARPDDRSRNSAVVVGSLLPDMPIYLMWLGAKFVFRVPEREIWQHLYWSEPWQTLGAIVNSLPLYLTLLVLAWGRGMEWLRIFALAALLHLAFDFPFHNEDAHRHFWPISDWRFRSPLSYWNSAHHGDIVGIVEIAMALVLIVVLWRRFTDWRVRAVLCVPPLSYVGVPLYFSLT